MRKALIVGINHYEHIPWLFGCVEDAHAIKAILERHGDGSVNFFTLIFLTGMGLTDTFNRQTLKSPIEELFKGDGLLPKNHATRYESLSARDALPNSGPT